MLIVRSRMIIKIIGVFPSGSVVMEILIDETLGWNLILISDQNSEIEVGI